MKKSKLQSKTLWANGVALIASLSVAAGLDLGMTEQVQAGIVVAALSIVNIVLRFTTSQQLE